VHRENGNCNLKELYKIIQEINPEVIFEEISPSRFDEYYNKKTVCSLETNTIIKYLQTHKIEHIPVDDYDFTKIIEMYNNFNHIDDILFNNIDYCDLWENNIKMANQYGFKYLNSIYYDELSEKLHFLEENIIKDINDEKLSQIYKLYNDFNDNRENAMIKNIYLYSNDHRYINSVLLIGAEHKRSMAEKIWKYKKNEELILNWNIKNYENI
jgi:hypothetical protein